MVSVTSKVKQKIMRSKTASNALSKAPKWLLHSRKVHSITMEVTSACNLRCPFCPVGQRKVAPHMMDVETHKKIIDMLPKSIKEIRYNYRGEPFVNKDLLKMIKYTSDKGIKTFISTNGTLMGRFAEELAESGLDRLYIAIDGASQETQGLYRIGSNLDNIKLNVKQVVEARKKSKGKFPKEIVIQNVLSSKNEHEIEKMQQMGRDLGVDKIKFKTIAISFGSNYEQGKDEQEAFLPKNKDYWRTGKDNKICPFVWETIILYNGDISICCTDYLAQYIMGNIVKEGSFEKVIYGEKYTKFRRQIAKRGLGICKNCPITGEYWISGISLDYRKERA